MEYKCDECGKIQPPKYLMLDTDTEDYLCPTCYRSRLAKKEKNDFLFSTTINIMAVTLLLLLFSLFLIH